VSLSRNYHSFHLVDPSIWPFFTSIWAGLMAYGTVQYMHNSIGIISLIAFFHLLFALTGWWRDVISESFIYHTKAVQRGLRLGFILFIVSEVMFFFGFFWAFLHSSVAPSVFIGCQWPPKGIVTFNPWTVPLANTLILLLSGASITWAHHAILEGKRVEAHNALSFTVSLAFLFTLLQYIEYKEAAFSISDSVYGSSFFMMTGFHGFHVIIGTIFILVCTFRNLFKHFEPDHHLGFEAAAWYWHFVDVVWLFLFILVYWWGGLSFVNDSSFSSILAF